jgi:hypothetical protein
MFVAVRGDAGAPPLAAGTSDSAVPDPHWDKAGRWTSGRSGQSSPKTTGSTVWTAVPWLLQPTNVCCSGLKHRKLRGRKSAFHGFRKRLDELSIFLTICLTVAMACVALRWPCGT